MKLLEIDNPEFFYKEEAIIIAKEMIECISNNEYDYNGFIEWEYNCKILNDLNYISWTYSVERADSDLIRELGYDIWAYAGPDDYYEPAIHLTFIIPKFKRLKSIQINESNLIGVIAHEIHHIAQNIKSHKDIIVNEYHDRIKNKSRKTSYLLSKQEIEAFKIGFRAESLISGDDEKDLMTKYLTALEIDEKDIQVIIEAWTNYPIKMIKTF